MIGFRHFGRMGNFLFQAAAAYGYAKKHELEFSVPAQTNDPIWNPLYLQHLVNPKWNDNAEHILINEIWNEQQHYQEIPFKEEWRNMQIVLNGYWQSPKYFDFCRDEILKAFNYPYEKREGWCSIHVRRGDYLLHPTKHPVVTLEYIEAAIAKAIESGCNKFLFFSDDTEWCKEAVYFLPTKLYNACELGFSEDRTPEEDLMLMSNCQHNIISNSSMAWWSAWLNQNHDKIVICPDESNWFGPDNHFSVKDLYPPEWVRIKY